MEDIICVSPETSLTQALAKRVYAYKPESQNGYKKRKRIKNDEECMQNEKK